MQTLRNFLAHYNNLLQRRPLSTKCSSAFVIFTAADSIAQVSISQAAAVVDDSAECEMKLDVQGAMLYGLLYGAGWVAPVWHIFYQLTSSWGVSKVALAARVVVSAAAMDPVNFCVGMVAHRLAHAQAGEAESELGIAGYRLQQGLRTARDKIVSIYTIGLCFWPVVHSLNNSVVPVQWRVLLLNCSSLGWMTWMSSQMHGDPLQPCLIRSSHYG